MDRPARVQVSKNVLDEVASRQSLEQQQQQNPSAVFNTWYGKWAGGDRQNTKFRSPHRCAVERDSGYTKSQSPPFCIWFARGACFKGSDCEALHRIPRQDDSPFISNATDCFGRLKHADYRDDMGGVGSLLKENRTLFVGYFEKESGPSHKLLEKVRTQFMEWGNVERVRLGKNNSIAFVTYTCELNAQFAKEAMSNQTVTGKEVLLVRWSRDSANGKPQESSEEDRVRQIVRRVIKVQREAELATRAKESKKRPIEEDNGLLSSEAAARLRQLKESRAETQENKTTGSPGTQEPVESTNLLAEKTTKKRKGLVDYD